MCLFPLRRVGLGYKLKVWNKEKRGGLILGGFRECLDLVVVGRQPATTLLEGMQQRLYAELTICIKGADVIRPDVLCDVQGDQISRFVLGSLKDDLSQDHVRPCLLYTSPSPRD